MKPEITLKDYAQIQFMSAIISNPATITEFNKMWNLSDPEKRLPFPDAVAKQALMYTESFLKQQQP